MVSGFVRVDAARLITVVRLDEWLPFGAASVHYRVCCGMSVVNFAGEEATACELRSR
jgi:hypothetical protein